MSSRAAGVLPLLLAAGCFAPGVLTAPADAPDELRALGPTVVLLATPHESEEAVIGTVVEEGLGPTLTRTLVVPRSDSAFGYLRYEGLREIGVGAGGGVALGGLDADLAAESVTHVSYSVTISDTIYLAGEQAYDLRSDCCGADGSVDPSCEGGYVTRAFVGSGTFRYLARTDVGGSFSAGPIETWGGATFAVERERYFSSAVFAVEVAPAGPICARAFCDERDDRGRCVRCRALGMQSELGMLAAPADDLLEVGCGEMPPGADARVTIRGELEASCSIPVEATLAVGTTGGLPVRVELDPIGPMHAPIALARTIEGLTTSSGGTLSASIDLVSCTCGGMPARCRLGSELELAIETLVPR